MKSTAKATGIEGRIVNLSSIAHLHTYEEGIRFDKLNEQDGYVNNKSIYFSVIQHELNVLVLDIMHDFNRYSDKKAYGQSKLANILHASELSRRLQVLIFVNLY